MKYFILAFLFLYHCVVSAVMEPARMDTKNWLSYCSGNNTSSAKHWFGLPSEGLDNPAAVCQMLCQNDFADFWHEDARKAANGQSGEFIWYPSSNGTGPGLNFEAKWYGSCKCGGWSGGGMSAAPYILDPRQYLMTSCTSFPTIVKGPALCDFGTPVPSYAPASCMYYGGEAANAPTACASTAGNAVVKMVVIPSGQTVTPNGCYVGCEYAPQGGSQIVQVNGTNYAKGTFVGKGVACYPQTPPLQDIPAAVAGSNTFATEATQLENKSLLQQILQKIGVSGGGGGGGSSSPLPSETTGYNAGGDIARNANASEAVAAALAASGPGSVDLAAEGQAAIDAGKNLTSSGILDSLPQETVDLSTAFESVKITVFGDGVCPAPAYMFDWNGHPVNFDFGIVCQFAVALSALILAAASVKGFGIVMGG